MKIGIIGTGSLGGALGRRWARGDHEITFGVRNLTSEKARAVAAEAGARIATVAQAAAGAEVVVLAVPWSAVGDALQAAGDLSDKVLVDCTNAVGAGYRPAVESTTSGAEVVARLAPGAKVVKAFNTLGAGMLADLDLGDAKPAMFFCGDDNQAKTVVRGLAEELGFEAVDVGPLAAAPLLESAALLWITLAYRQRLGPQFTFGLLRRSVTR